MNPEHTLKSSITVMATFWNPAILLISKRMKHKAKYEEKEYEK